MRAGGGAGVEKCVYFTILGVVNAAVSRFSAAAAAAASPPSPPDARLQRLAPFAHVHACVFSANPRQHRNPLSTPPPLLDEPQVSPVREARAACFFCFFSKFPWHNESRSFDRMKKRETEKKENRGKDSVAGVGGSSPTSAKPFIPEPTRTGQTVSAL